MTETSMQNKLIELFENDNDEEGNSNFYVGTFNEHGLLTMNKGIVIRDNKGNEYQITIVQSRSTEDDVDEED